ncbi:pleckstrin homology domain-containing family H member 1 isoform X2 [Erpetoichthys calabaricus]|uniref:pleckstrin homology domain-containing family H member 1 isoform X2 n=1 Tax=Erpetoichthys calabaricus TaxID=27687 RepID=UPI0022343A2A|nr:pleckstrin homology domain-containing family H member 1 isoform X2 [Erpetoichthys calabaricus]
MAELVENGGVVDWQKRCVALESQLLKFRLQASKIRELLAEKMQELEQRVMEADQRAEQAEKQLQVMEEKLKSANVHPSESENALYRRYQELSSQAREKDELIQNLELQLEKHNQQRAHEARVIEEKAAKIKEWVTFKLRELEVENYQLKMSNQRQTELIQLLQDKIQALLENSGSFPNAESSQSTTAFPIVNSPSSPQAVEEPRRPPPTRLLPSPPRHYQDMKRKGGDGCDFPKSCSPPLLGPRVSPLHDCQSKSPSSGRKKACPESGDRLHSPSIIANPEESLLKAKDSQSSNSIPETHVPSALCEDTSEKYGKEPLDMVNGDVPLLEAGKDQDGLLEQSVPKRGSECEISSDELNNRFRSQRLHSSSSSSEANVPSPLDTPGLTPKQSTSSLSPLNSSLMAGVNPSGASMTLPKVRTPLTPRDSIQLAKKHYSQPQPGTDRLHHINVSIDINSFRPTDLPQLRPIHVEETDIDEVPDKMDTEDAEEELAEEQNFFAPLPERLEFFDSSITKPPTPPLHRFPSWESRIYAVAKSGMRLSEVPLGNGTPSRVSNFPLYPVSGPFTHLIYRNVMVPVYTTIKGKATQISNVPFLDESSGSEDDSSSHASLRTSSAVLEQKKSTTPGSPRAIKRGVSMSSVSSESDYAIPPDACSLDSDYSEPEHKLLRTSSYSSESSCAEPLEKSGYLLKMGSRVKAWKRRWFVLRNGEILYYKSPSDVIRKPQGQIELTSSCRIARGEGAQTFQLITEKKTYYLTADSPNILEEWIRVLQNLLKVQATNPVITEAAGKPSVRGWLTKVKHGHSKLVWCSLIGKVFHYYRNQDDRFPLGQLRMREARVEEVDRSCDSDEDYEAGGRGFLSSHYTLVVYPKEQSPTYLLIGSKHEKDAWLYHLTVAAGSSGCSKVGTEYEQMISKLLDLEGDADSPLWNLPILCYSKEGLHSPLTTLPSEALQTEALKLFKSCQLFINVLVEAPSIDYHVSLAQNALQVCLTHLELQNEIYCQLIKQTNRRQPHNYSLIQCWQLLSLCVALFLPHQRFLWYLKVYLHRCADPKSEVGKYAIYCQRSVERTLQNGDREAKPSRMEIMSILLRNPYHHSLPFSIPVHFMNGTYQVVGFDGSTSVDEFLSTLNQEAGMRKPAVSGFSLFTDDPLGKDLEHCLQGSIKICDVISKWEQALKEMHSGKYDGSRTVRLTYKSRMCFRAQAKGETERERLLLAYQINDDVIHGRFPVNKELALEVAALMAQVEYGDLDRPAPASPGGSSQAKMQQLLLQVLDKFYPKRYKLDSSPEQLRRLADRVATKWMVLRGCSASECVRIYLTVARKWSLFGAKLFTAKPVPPSPLEESTLWLAVSEEGISILEYSTMRLILTYPYQSVMTFGGCRDDFMIVVNQAKDGISGKRTIKKLVFAMPKPKILELTLLVASYINYWTSSFLSADPSLSTMPDKKLWDVDNKHFPSMTRTTKGPTLL